MPGHIPVRLHDPMVNHLHPWLIAAVPYHIRKMHHRVKAGLHLKKAAVDKRALPVLAEYHALGRQIIQHTAQGNTADA